MFDKAALKAVRHVGEQEKLAEWLMMRMESVVMAGDFNAPMYARNLRYPEMKHAHLVAGRNLHRTFPRKFPFWGIDHILGSRQIDFLEYTATDAGFSDHLAQYAEVRVVQ